jgi:hypothetical protein
MANLSPLKSGATESVPCKTELGKQTIHPSSGCKKNVFELSELNSSTIFISSIPFSDVDVLNKLFEQCGL